MQRAIFLPPGGSRPPPLLGSVHVTKLPKDDHGIDGLIADKFRSRGLTVATGPAKPEPLDAVVTCADRWMWDITMYPAIAELPLEDRAGPGSPKLGTSKATDGAFAMNEMTRPAAAAATVTPDRIERVELSLAYLPLATPVSDAKVFTGRQKPLTEVAFVFAEITSRDGLRGFGFGYSKRAGGPGMYAHAKEIAPNLIGEDPSDIQKIFDKLVWAGASMGRSGMTVQAIAPFDLALWDLKARRANLPLAKLIGAHRDSVRCYNTSGGFLSTPLPQVLENVTNSRESGIGGIKIKVGHPDAAEDLKRVSAVRRHLGDSFPLMVDANQQWDRPAAMRMCRALEPFGLVWIEEPLDAYDHEGHAALAAAFDAPIATGEMLTSFNEHAQLIEAGACDYVQPDCPRVGGVTQFLRILALADRKGLQLAPHFAMEIHVHLAATYPREPWLEHFDWLEPLFNERLEMRGGRAIVPSRPGIGFSLSDQARAWTVDRATITP